MRFPFTRHPFTTLSLAGALVVAACGESALVAPTTKVTGRTASGFGFVGSIGDYVWLDANGNGIQDVGEVGMAGVTLNLYAGSTCTGTPIGTQLSDPSGNGFYLFAPLAAGTYSVQVVTPSGFAPTTVNAAGSTSENDSNPACSTVTIADGEFNGSLDFGFVPAVVANEGCSPGYWKNHTNWPSPYTKTMLFSAVFSNAFPGKTLQQVLSTGGGGLIALGRQTVSALLNAKSLGAADFGLTTASVISQFNAAYASGNYAPLQTYFESLTDVNGRVCPLN